MVLAEELLRQAFLRGINPLFVLFDSWYSSKKFLHLIDDFGWHYICRAKRNRLFEGVKIGNRFRHRFGREIGKLKGVTYQILLVKDGQKFLMTNKIELNSAAIKRQYQKRQHVEETFRLLKQEFGWGSVERDQFRFRRHSFISDFTLYV